MVAVCDVLGYGEYIKRHSLDEAITHIRSIKDLARKSILTGYTPDGDITEFVGHMTFSDTVVFYSLRDNILAFEHLIFAALRILAVPLLYPQYRFRIGISYGEFHYDNQENLYVGKALVDAHELEKKQEWIGAVLSQEAFEKVETTAGGRVYLMKYNVPLKNDERESLYVINWTLARHDAVANERLFQREHNIPSPNQEMNIERKLRNTEQFHTDVCLQCRELRKNIHISK